MSETIVSTFLEHVLQAVQKHQLVASEKRSSEDMTKIIEFLPPEKLGEKIGSLDIGPGPIAEDKLDDILQRVVRYSVKTRDQFN